jgi:pyrroline-5-carboxylate reductase
MDKKIAVIGGGNMGGALIEGWLASGRVAPARIMVADAAETSRVRFKAMGLKTFDDNRAAVRGADIVVVAVKPWLTEAVAGEISPAMEPGAIVVSVAGGIPLGDLAGFFDPGRRIFRVIPNIAAALGESMTFVATVCEDKASIQTVTELFEGVGETALIPENMINAATIVGSCGTAFALRYLRATMEASIQMGLSAPLARKVAAQTIKGAAQLMLQTDLHPEAAVDRVTTPGGTTIVGLNAMEKNGFSSAVIEGHLAVWERMKKS